MAWPADLSPLTDKNVPTLGELPDFNGALWALSPL